MSRIVYLIAQPGALTGGNKVAFRHVEALVALGYDAVASIGLGTRAPAWFEHDAPIERWRGAPDPDDILVFSEDAAPLMAAAASLPNRKVVFCQSLYGAAVFGLTRLPPETLSRYRTFMSCSPAVAVWIARYLDDVLVRTVPAFADERLFVPRAKQRVIAAVTGKRRLEFDVIQYLFARIHPRAADWTWEVIAGRSEAETAAAMGGASVFLALPKIEALSMAVLEAMACGCIVAGFTGIGPRQYMTSMNGLWVEEDDCEAAAHALAQACALAEQDEAGAHLIRHAARTTAAHWSHAHFVEALDAFWRETMAVTPATR